MTDINFNLKRDDFLDLEKIAFSYEALVEIMASNDDETIRCLLVLLRGINESFFNHLDNKKRWVVSID